MEHRLIRWITMDDGSRDKKFLAVFISDILVAALTGMILYGVISSQADTILNVFMGMSNPLSGENCRRRYDGFLAKETRFSLCGG